MAKRNYSSISSHRLGKIRSVFFPELSVFLFFLVVSFVFCASASGGIYQLLVRTTAIHSVAAAPNPQVVVTDDVQEPEESKVKTNTYNVPADQPKNIVLPTINSSGPIQRVWVNSKNSIAVPTNAHFAGWYANSEKPGNAGLSVVVGHVSGKYVEGIFKRLSLLKTRDRFSIEYGDGSLRNFEVVETKTLPESETAKYLLTKRSDLQKQLNLITCAGKFNKQTQTFSDRTIVVTKSID